MILFATNESVAAMEAARPQAHGAARLQLLVELAWQLRQRDCDRALALADEAQALLERGPVGAADAQHIEGRLMLIRGEVRWLCVHLDEAQGLADAALRTFDSLQDWVGCGDAQWLLASIHHDRGQMQARDECLAAAMRHYGQTDDRDRIQAAAARRLERGALRDANATLAGLAQLAIAEQQASDLVKTWVHSAQGLAALVKGDPSSSIKIFTQAHAAAVRTGQIRQAILVRCNGADALATMGDLGTALTWNEDAIQMARQAKWPYMLGLSLIEAGNTMRLLERNVEAKSMLEEALETLKDLPNASPQALAWQYLGEVALSAGDPSAALAYFGEAEQRNSALKWTNLVLRCWCDQARALGRLGRYDEARIKVTAALELAREQGSLEEQVHALWILGELHLQCLFPVAEAMTSPSPALHYFNQALDLAASITGYVIPNGFLEDVAKAYATVGDFQQAHARLLTAIAARDAKQLAAARNGLITLQARLDVERAQNEAERHRQLAQAEALRAKELMEWRETLEILGLMGRELTASLDRHAVCIALHRHVNDLLDVTTFNVYQLSHDGTQLNTLFSLEAGQSSRIRDISIDDPQSLSARCIRERREIHVDLSHEPPTSGGTWIPGTLDTVSLLFAPLFVGDRLLGVITIQSIHAGVYGERERAIFRTLCAYGAIALDNAAAYALAERARIEADQALVELRHAQDKLIQVEKLASLGHLVAGVAHELNTPIGISLTAASALENSAQEFQRSVSEGAMKRSTLDKFLQNTQEMSALLVRSCERAAHLISSFKQVAVDQTSEHRRDFDLLDLVTDNLASLRPSLQNSTWSIEVDVPAGLRCDSYPGPLGQVLTNLIQNAGVHAFENRTSGLLRVAASQTGDTIELVVSDNGQGMSAQTLSHIFEPFYTTKLGKGGSGLGLAISQNMVTAILGGQLTVSSQPGVGSQFVVRFPAVAPHSAKP